MSVISSAFRGLMVTAESNYTEKTDGKHIARSASKRTDEWPFWMVWDGQFNVTGRVAEKLGYGPQNGGVFTTRENAERLASEANAGNI